jgi:hypothetical protein
VAALELLLERVRAITGVGETSDPS